MLEIEGVDDTLAVCKRALLEAELGLSPGIAFSPESAKQIRICYAKSDAVLEEAMRRLATFLSKD
jgi:aspartate/methionine/tyrosine aminotransferase